MVAKRAVLYARVSSDDTKKDSRNLTGQIEMCRQHAQSKGWRIVAELPEDEHGASGADLDLPKLNQAIEMAHAGAYDVLVVREIDRFARRLSKQLVTEEELRRSGVQIEYVLGEYPDTPEGNLLKHVKATIAEYEREKINERMTRGRHQKVKSGSVLVADRPPYGYNVVKEENGLQKLEVDEDQASIIRMIFRWYTCGDPEEGPVSLRQIAARLTKMGVPTYCEIYPDYRMSSKRLWLGVWSSASVHEILKKETYTGIWRYGKTTKVSGTLREVQDSPWAVSVPAIIDVETWKAALAKLAQNKQDAKRNRKYNYLLSGRVNCGACGGKMHGNSVKKSKSVFTYYTCNARRFPDKYIYTCNAPRFQVKYVDPVVWNWVRSLLTDPEALSIGLNAQHQEQEKARQPLRDELSKVTRLIDENVNHQERLLDIYLDGSIPKEVWEERNSRIEITLRALKQRQDELLMSINEDAFTADQIHDIQNFAAQIGRSIGAADGDFPAQRRIIELLNVHATLCADEDGMKFASVSCVLGKDVVCIASETMNCCC